MPRPPKPWCPPLVAIATDDIGHLLEWRQHERDGSWWAWISWVQMAGDRPRHHVVEVQAASLRPLEGPEAYEGVPRRIFGRDGKVRPWTRQASETPRRP